MCLCVYLNTVGTNGRSENMHVMLVIAKLPYFCIVTCCLPCSHAWSQFLNSLYQIEILELVC